MKDFDVVESSETLDNLDKDAPNFFFLEIGLLFLVLSNFLKQVAAVGILHHDAEVLAVNECVTVANYGGVLEPAEHFGFEQGRATRLGLDDVHALHHIRVPLLKVANGMA